MAALTNEFGWLISALHGLYSNKSRSDGQIIKMTKMDKMPRSGWSGLSSRRLKHYDLLPSTNQRGWVWV